MWAKIKEWLTTHSDFMNEVGFLATMGHIGWACLITLSAALLSNLNMHVCEGVSGGLIGLAAIKEYVYDANFERPVQTWKDNTEDFVGYLGGIALAWFVIMIHALCGSSIIH
jgi:hypothetical protein